MGHQRSSKLHRLLGRSFRADRQAPGAARNALRVPQRLARSRSSPRTSACWCPSWSPTACGTPGSAEIELEVWSSDEVVRVDVSDHGAGFDLAGPPTPGDASGWGLFMVDRLADRWGVETERRHARLVRADAPGRGRPRAPRLLRLGALGQAARRTTTGGPAVISGGVCRSRISSSWSTFSKNRSTSRGSKCLPRSSRMICMVFSSVNALR